MQLADPKVEQLAEYELARGPFEYGGTWVPYESVALFVMLTGFCSIPVVPLRSWCPDVIQSADMF